ncbi:hypothetical protein LOAG_13087 [Loa loa]|uniref:DUF1768 domain-containing protein n=1 Tax=Loa loa TaxID=7209 RepID=A0A1I7VQQ2_LOALO|nr:hypothetical protein LOAG_13087 [Loa loa]EFO15423.1 hypothetical protein LOAG_13087 [Loa loa]
MHYTGGYLSYSHVLATCPYDTAMPLRDHEECRIQSCIRMEQGNWIEEDESAFRKNFFLGIGFGSGRAKLKKIINKMGAENCEGKQEEWSSRMIAEQLRRLADNFEAEFQKASASTRPYREKSDTLLVSSPELTYLNMKDSTIAYNHC